MHFPNDFPLVDLMMKYPGGCSEAEKREVQQSARATMNAALGLDAEKWTWAREFWRHNYDVVKCKPHGYPLNPGKIIDESAGNAALERSTVNATTLLAIFGICPRHTDLTCSSQSVTKSCLASFRG
jgi:hypothetical protein